jgi:hypothetical protein
MAKNKPFTGNTFNKVETMRGAFESQYGASPDDNKKVLIGMRGGKAVYGDALDAADTSGKNIINNTYSQNQAIINDMFKETAQSGDMYNPSAKDIAAAERMSPVTAADKTVTKRGDTEMVGAYSPQAAAMREKTSTTPVNPVAPAVTPTTAPAATGAPAAPEIGLGADYLKKIRDKKKEIQNKQPTLNAVPSVLDGLFGSTSDTMMA